MTLDPVRARRLTITYRLLLAACSLLLGPSWGRTQEPAAPKPTPLPKPFETIQDAKQFNAARFGPGNTISFVETPPDFHLYTFALSAGVTSDRQSTIAVPSAKGLIFYRPSDMEGTYATDKPTADVAFVSGRNSFVNFSGVLTFLSEKGKPLCEKSYKGRVNYAVSGDGQWLAISQFSSVDLWRVEDLLRDCDSGL
jgi:hypothetical protein